MKPINAFAVLSCLFSSLAFAQGTAYPVKPITLVVNSAAGGPTDAAARAMKDHMAATLGQQLVIDNRLAAGGNVGAAQVAKSEPNGYTLLMSGTGPITIAPLLVKNIGYDPEKDLAPLALVVTLPGLIVASNGTEAKTLQEFIALAKANPGKYTYASVGNGTPSHLATEMLKMLAGVNLLHVPYKGSPQAQTAVLANEVSIYFAPMAVLDHARNGRLRALAQTGLTRAKMAPEVPTARESGLPEMVFTPWFGLFGPAGLPRAIADQVSGAALKALADPKVQEAIVKYYGVDASPLGPAEFAKFIHEDLERWSRVIRTSGIKAD